MLTARKLSAAKLKERRDRLMPGGVPKHIRCYDNGGLDAPEGTADRYTVVFTKANCFMGSDRRSPHLLMNESPFSPQGIGMHGESESPIDRPTYSHLGKKIRFADLPEDCRRAVVQDYVYYSDLEGV